MSCGHGVQSSSHFIVQPRQYGGRECEGPGHRSRVCTGPDCGKKSYKTLGIGLEYSRIRCVCVLPMVQLCFDYTTVCVWDCLLRCLSFAVACPEGERWRRSTSESERVCDRGCVDMYSAEPLNCTEASRLSEGCVCEEGRYRDAKGRCVIPALCQCEGEDGTLQEVYTQTRIVFKMLPGLTISRQTKTNAYTLTHIRKHAGYSLTASAFEPSFTPPDSQIPEQCTEPSIKKTTAFLCDGCIASYLYVYPFRGLIIGPDG